MKAQDYSINADLIRRVIERVKALPNMDLMSQQEAILGVLEMMEEEFRAAPQIMPVDPS